MGLESKRIKMEGKLDSLSAFFPAYNEEKNVQKLTRNLLKVLPEVAEEYEIVIVNDGSTDRTKEIIHRLAKENRCIRAVHHKENLGYGAAIRSGLINSRYSYIFFTDGDNQFNVFEIKKLIRYINGYDIIAGYRVNRKDNSVRKFNAWIWNILVRLLFGLKMRDVDCAFKLFRREVVNKINTQAEGAMINTEILAQARKYGFTIKQVGIHHYPRQWGKQSGANFEVIVKAFWELIKVYKRLKGERR